MLGGWGGVASQKTTLNFSSGSTDGRLKRKSSVKETNPSLASLARGLIQMIQIHTGCYFCLFSKEHFNISRVRTSCTLNFICFSFKCCHLEALMRDGLINVTENIV